MQGSDQEKLMSTLPGCCCHCVSLAFSIFFWGWSSLVAGGHSCPLRTASCLQTVWDPSLGDPFNQDSPLPQPRLSQGGPSVGWAQCRTPPPWKLCVMAGSGIHLLQTKITAPTPSQAAQCPFSSSGSRADGWPYSSDSPGAHFPADTHTQKQHLQTTLASLASEVGGKVILSAGTHMADKLLLQELIWVHHTSP